MTAIGATRMAITRLISDRLRIVVRVRGACIIPARVCACLVLAIGDRTSGYPMMTAIGATRMPTTCLIASRIGVGMWRAGIISTPIGTPLSIAIGDRT